MYKIYYLLNRRWWICCSGLFFVS